MRVQCYNVRYGQVKLIEFYQKKKKMIYFIIVENVNRLCYCVDLIEFEFDKLRACIKVVHTR